MDIVLYEDTGWKCCRHWLLECNILRRSMTAFIQRRSHPAWRSGPSIK